MALTEVQSIPTLPARDSGKTWRRLKSLLVIAGFLGSGLLNVLTLVNDTIHAAAYGIVKAVLASVASESAVSRVLRNSTASVRTADVAKATKALRDEKSTLSVANAALESKHSALAKAQSELSAKYAKLEAANSTLKDEHAALGKAYKEIDAKHAALVRTSQANAATVQKVSKRIATRSLTNATRNSTSVVGESIPYLGIALIVGVTAWDLYDACETMKDVNEMNMAFGHTAEDQARVCGMKVPTKDQVLSELGTNWRYAYGSAAAAINRAGSAVVSFSPPVLTWPDVRGTICPVIGYVPAVCP